MYSKGWLVSADDRDGELAFAADRIVETFEGASVVRVLLTYSSITVKLEAVLAEMNGGDLGGTCPTDSSVKHDIDRNVVFGIEQPAIDVLTTGSADDVDVLSLQNIHNGVTPPF